MVARTSWCGLVLERYLCDLRCGRALYGIPLMKLDSELLQQYATSGNEAAFAEVVNRHVNLVYAAAVRMLNGDAALAEEVTQAAFTEMARRAAMLATRESVAGWLHVTTRYLASHAIRTEQRRRAHEQEASAMNEQNSPSNLPWSQVRPLIDEAVAHLLEHERNAVLLRFFEGKSHREVGEELGLTENAARMRVERAVEKMRRYFSQHGVNTTGALLATTLGARAASKATPVVFAQGVAGKSLLGLASTGGVTAGIQGGKWITGKIAAILAGVTALAATLFSWVYHEAGTLPPPQPRVAATAPIVKTPISNRGEIAKTTPTAEIPAEVMIPVATSAVMAASSAPEVVATANDLATTADQAIPPSVDQTPPPPADQPAPPQPENPTPTLLPTPVVVTAPALAKPTVVVAKITETKSNVVVADQSSSSLRFANTSAPSADIERLIMMQQGAWVRSFNGGTVELFSPMAGYALLSGEIVQGAKLNDARSTDCYFYLVKAAGSVKMTASVRVGSSGEVTLVNFSPGGGTEGGATPQNIAAAIQQLSKLSDIEAHGYEVRLLTMDLGTGGTLLTVLWLVAGGDAPELVFIPDQANVSSPLQVKHIYADLEFLNIARTIAIKRLQAEVKPPVKRPAATGTAATGKATGTAATGKATGTGTAPHPAASAATATIPSRSSTGQTSPHAAAVSSSAASTSTAAASSTTAATGH
jgi:RNA polymerase sigma factor (sigma-70 family)